MRLWHDGSGHLLPPPPPYREEEEALYGFGNELQLRRLLPSLGVMSPESGESWPRRQTAHPPCGIEEIENENT